LEQAFSHWYIPQFTSILSAFDRASVESVELC
jgi:hypothetical protein